MTPSVTPASRWHPDLMETPAQRLEAAHAEAVARVARLTGEYDDVVAASRDTNADDEHDPEGATIAFERSQIGTVVRLARRHLAEVEAAQDRLADGTYGTCEECAGPIGADRLEARPAARTCIRCASAR